MYVSFDDGDHWQSLQLNLPTTSYRDIAFKGNDLIVGTYGRGIWVLDDYAVLRQMTPAMASEAVHLFKPGDAVRVRRNVGADTPFPPEVPHALNPPDGAIIYYWLPRAPAGEITIDVLDSAGAVVRHCRAMPIAPVTRGGAAAASELLGRDAAAAADGRRHEPRELGSALRRAAGVHALVRDQRQSRTHAGVARGAARAAGRVHDQAHGGRQELDADRERRNDPRSPATAAAIRAQHALQMRMYAGIKAAYAGHEMATTLQTALRGAVSGGASPISPMPRPERPRSRRASIPSLVPRADEGVGAAAEDADAVQPRPRTSVRSTALSCSS